MTRQMIYDEYDDKWSEIGLCKETGVDMETEFQILFNDKEEGRRYIVSGTHQLWHGTHSGYNRKVYSSLSDAIIDSQEGFTPCWTQVYEGKYGKLFFNTCHHDGTNRQEIKELTELGKELNSKGYGVKKLLQRRGATRNVHLIKRLKNKEKEE